MGGGPAIVVSATEIEPHEVFGSTPSFADTERFTSSSTKL